VSPTAEVVTTASLVPCNALAPVKPGVGVLPAAVLAAVTALAVPLEVLKEPAPQPHKAISGNAARDARTTYDA